MISLECDQMTDLNQMRRSEIAYKTENILWKFFDLMISLDSDKMTALWPKGSLTFTFHETFANSMSKWTTLFRKWPNDCFVPHVF